MTFFCPERLLDFFSVLRSSVFFLSPTKQLPDYRASPGFFVGPIGLLKSGDRQKPFHGGFFLRHKNIIYRKEA